MNFVGPEHDKIDQAFKTAEEVLPLKNNEIKKEWISEDTMRLIKEKHWMEQTGDNELQNKIKEVRKAKRNDWKKWAHNVVTQDLDIRDRWLGIRT